MSKVHRMGLQKIHKISKTRVVIQTYEVSLVFMSSKLMRCLWCAFTHTPPQTMHACVCVVLALPSLVCWYDLAIYLLGYP